MGRLRWSLPAAVITAFLICMSNILQRQPPWATAHYRNPGSTHHFRENPWQAGSHAHFPTEYDRFQRVLERPVSTSHQPTHNLDEKRPSSSVHGGITDDHLHDPEYRVVDRDKVKSIKNRDCFA